MTADPFTPLGGARKTAVSPPPWEWTAVTPVPEDAPAPPAKHFRNGAPSATWRYRDPAGRLLHLVLRFDGKGEKTIRPLSWCRSTTGKNEWRWQAATAPRPLYGLERLAARPDAPVLVVEGEKAADAAGRLLPDYVAITSSGGSKAAGKAEWSPLGGRIVIIWPDADQPGRAYAGAVADAATAAGARSVALVTPPGRVAEGWDAADAEAEGWSPAQAGELVAGAAAAGGKAQAPGRQRRAPQRDELMALTELVELWHDQSGEPFMSMSVNGHFENWASRATRFGRWLSNQWYEEHGTALGSQALEDCKRVLEARACNVGPEHKTFTRIGRDGDRLYLDLGDPTWRAIEVTAAGWQIVAKPPVKFLRSPSMRALPEPEAGGTIEELRGYLNVRTDEDATLIIAWLVGAFRDRGPYPILVLNGEQGSGKSGVSRLLRSLVDPALAPIRSAPREDRDLIVSASNSWVLAYDNLSQVPDWLSDALCRLATGGGFAARQLHTDREEAVFEASRPIILNGIPQLANRPDLADRALTIHLPAISETARQPEDEFWTNFERSRPRILAALLDAISTALRLWPSIRLKSAPRLADFAKWVTAAEPGLGWRAGSFLDVYRSNRREVADAAFEADPVAVTIKEFVETEAPYGWEGTVTELLEQISNRVPEALRKNGKVWPGTAQAMGNRFVRIAPLLRSKGFAVDKRHSGDRRISIVPPAPAARD